MKLLHAADLHIDSPLRGLSRYPGAPVERIRGAARQALGNLVALAIAERVSLVLLAGDVYDGDWQDYHTGLFFTQQMNRLREADIPVCMVAGNHDAASRITHALKLPDNVHNFGTREPGTRHYDDLGIAVHGQGFGVRDVFDNLAKAYPDPERGMFNVGLLHTAISGNEGGHRAYAPCTVDDLRARGYHYWALGHIHARRVVHDGGPWIVYPGNIQGRHAKEAGPKGATLVTVDGTDVTLEHRDLDVVRWADVRVDTTGTAHPDEVRARVEDDLTRARDAAGDRLLAARVTLTGRTECHEELQRAQEHLAQQIRADAGGLRGLWVEKVKVKTGYAHDPGSAEDRSGVVADLRRTAGLLRADPDALETFVVSNPLFRKLGVHAGEADLHPRDTAWREQLFDEAMDMLIAMVSGDTGGDR